MAKPRNKTLDLLQYLALRWLHTTLHCWPVEVNLWLARRLGDVMYAVDKRHRHRAMANLRSSFPDWPEARLQRVTRESMQQLFCLFIEVLWTPRLVRLETFPQIVELGEFQPTLRRMVEKHNGLILLTGHYGNWEVLGYALATLGFPTVSVARPLDNPYVNEFLLGVRERRGQKIIAKKGATDEVVATLDRGGMVAFIADQNAGPKGIFVDFFGRSASTYKSIGLLAMEKRVPVIVGWARRKRKGFSFEVGTQDVILPEHWEHEPDPLRYITQRYTRAIEDFVRADPGQYLWVHRRWKTRPRGESAREFD